MLKKPVQKKTLLDDTEAELSMKAQDLHIKYAAPNEWEDRVKDDILTQQLVVICERFVRENSLGLREPDSRYRIREPTKCGTTLYAHSTKQDKEKHWMTG